MAEETTPTAPAEAPKAPESVENPTNTNEPAPSETPFLDKMDKKDLASIDKFLANNGGIEAFNKWKQDVSNPKSKAEEKSVEAPIQEPEKPAEPVPAPQPKTPEGAITQAEFMAQQYFKALAGEEKYAPISKEIASGDLLKEMASFNIQPLNQDGSINDTMVRRFLDLKAQTVPAQPTNSEPNMSNAPTVDYISVGDKIDSLEQAQAVFMQKGHPAHQMAADYIKATLAGKDPNAKPVDKK